MSLCTVIHVVMGLTVHVLALIICLAMLIVRCARILVHCVLQLLLVRGVSPIISQRHAPFAPITARLVPQPPNAPNA